MYSLTVRYDVAMLVVVIGSLQVHAVSFMQIGRLHTNYLDGPSAAGNLNQILTAFQTQPRNDSTWSNDVTDSRPALAPLAAAPISQLSSIISEILSAIGSIFTHALGPFAPIATAIGPSIYSALTGILSNGLSGFGSVLKREDQPESAFETFLVNIPDQGNYILMTQKSQLKAPIIEKVTPVPAPGVDYHIHNFFNIVQQLQKQQMETKQQEQFHQNQ